MENYSQEGNRYNGQLCQTTKRRIYSIRIDRFEILKDIGNKIELISPA